MFDKIKQQTNLDYTMKEKQGQVFAQSYKQELKSKLKQSRSPNGHEGAMGPESQATLHKNTSQISDLLQFNYAPEYNGPLGNNRSVTPSMYNSLANSRTNSHSKLPSRNVGSGLGFQ